MRGMRNARKELLENLEILVDNPDVTPIYGYVREVYYNLDNPRKWMFTNNSEFHSMLNELDFEYDGGYGSQHLDGMIMLSDGSWLSRGEYDGSEWWELHKAPTLEKIREYFEL